MLRLSVKGTDFLNNWTLRPYNAFPEYRAVWDELNDRGHRTPLLESRFVEALLEVFGRPGDIFAVATNGSVPRAMALLRKIRPGVWSTLQPSQAPLGLWNSPDSVRVDLLVDTLLPSLPKMALLLAITQQDPDIRPRPHGSRLRTLEYIRTARITVKENFTDYWAARGKNLRHNLKRQRNRLGKQGIKTRLETLTDPEMMSVAVADYGQLESSGWKSARGTAVHPDNDQGRFYRRVLESFAGSGHARVYRYFYGNSLVASDLCISNGRCLVILKTTYDENQTSTSPAMLMRQQAFEKIFDHKEVEAIEFYGAVMDWHTKWTNEIRTMYHVNCYRWTSVSNLHSLYRRLTGSSEEVDESKNRVD